MSTRGSSLKLTDKAVLVYYEVKCWLISLANKERVGGGRRLDIYSASATDIMRTKRKLENHWGNFRYKSYEILQKFPSSSTALVMFGIATWVTWLLMTYRQNCWRLRCILTVWLFCIFHVFASRSKGIDVYGSYNILIETG